MSFDGYSVPHWDDYCGSPCIRVRISCDVLYKIPFTSSNSDGGAPSTILSLICSKSRAKNIFARVCYYDSNRRWGIKTYFLPKRREKKKKLIKSPARYEPAAQRQHHQIIQISHEMRSGVLPISPSWVQSVCLPTANYHSIQLALTRYAAANFQFDCRWSTNSKTRNDKIRARAHPTRTRICLYLYIFLTRWLFSPQFKTIKRLSSTKIRRKRNFD